MCLISTLSKQRLADFQIVIYLIYMLRHVNGNSTSAEDPPEKDPPEDPPHSSISPLNLVGWCEEGHPTSKNSLQLSQG